MVVFVRGCRLTIRVMVRIKPGFCSTSSVGVRRPYNWAIAVSLAGNFKVEYSLASCEASVPLLIVRMVPVALSFSVALPW